MTEPELLTTSDGTRAAQALAQRLDELRAGPGYRNYLRVRDEVLRMKDAQMPENASPSDYWVEELESIEHLFDASPLVVERLRHHTYTVTGIRPYDYRSGKDDGRLRAKLDALVELGGRELLVPEPEALGGFGFDIGGELYNVDTLKYYEALIAMERGGILGGFRNPGERRIALEIGTGFGGFAYQFKTLFPDTTYVLVDLPELFLFSATYLLTLFHDAKVVFCSDDRPVAEEAWLEADFVFVPNTSLAQVRPPWLDLALNMVSFQEMTAAQVEEYVRTAHELGAPFLYSLNREHSHYNTQLDSVTAILERWFWPRVVPVLPVSYVKMLDSVKQAKPAKVPKPGKPGKPAKPAKEKPAKPGKDLDYKHIVGTRRVEA